MSSQRSVYRESVSYVSGMTRENHGRNARKHISGWLDCRREWRRVPRYHSKRKTLRDYRSNLKYETWRIADHNDFMIGVIDGIWNYYLSEDNLSLKYQIDRNERLFSWVHDPLEVHKRAYSEVGIFDGYGDYDDYYYDPLCDEIQNDRKFSVYDRRWEDDLDYPDYPEDSNWDMLDQSIADHEAHCKNNLVDEDAELELLAMLKFRQANKQRHWE